MQRSHWGDPCARPARRRGRWCAPLALELKGGDPEAAVIGECVAALLQLDAQRSLRLVGRLLALGEARPEGLCRREGISAALYWISC